MSARSESQRQPSTLSLIWKPVLVSPLHLFLVLSGLNIQSFYTIWDTFRSAYSLTNLLYADRYVDILRPLIDIWRHDGFLPDGRSSNYNGRTQGGSNADNLFGKYTY